MKSETYYEIITVIQNYIGLSRDCEKLLQEKFPLVAKETLGSILSLEHIKQIRKKNVHSPIFLNKLIEKYTSGMKIIDIALIYEVPPTLVAKTVLEHRYEHLNQNPNQFRIIISKMLKDSSRIENKHLAYEVFQAVMLDNQVGPVSNAIKHSIGEEYEQRLKYYAETMKLCYKDENQLRANGFDKTPDLKLEIPISVDGHIVNWIESKALFVDQKAHLGYVKDQFQSYWNRFGPGMVIYWFGYLDEIIDEEESAMFIIRDYFPINEIQCMDP